jgi:putative transposase
MSTLSPGRIVQIFKSMTAREIFAGKPSVKKHLWGGEFWTDGYYVATSEKAPIGEQSRNMSRN